MILFGDVNVKDIPTTRLIERLLVGLTVTMSLVLPGCNVLSSASSKKELAAFKRAGPVYLNVDFGGSLGGTAKSRGPYRLVPGDVLELQMPAIIGRLANDSAGRTEAYLCRVNPDGNILLPIVGEVAVVGKTLSQIESLIVDLYYPKYVLQKPGIVTSVTEYRTGTVTLAGAVEEAGTYELRSNEMNLVSALMRAGGIAKGGATTIHIRHADQEQGNNETIAVVGMNIPSKDVKLTDGDTIVVEALDPQVITVIGLVKKPGLFPWSPQNKYSVMDALAFAGGINDIADPQFVKVYRLGSDGKVVSAVLKLNGPSAVGASELFLKPGDVVAVEQTARTRTRVFLAQILRMGFGINAGVSPN